MFHHPHVSPLQAGLLLLQFKPSDTLAAKDLVWPPPAPAEAVGPAAELAARLLACVAPRPAASNSASAVAASNSSASPSSPALVAALLATAFAVKLQAPDLKVFGSAQRKLLP